MDQRKESTQSDAQFRFPFCIIIIIIITIDRPSILPRTQIDSLTLLSRVCSCIYLSVSKFFFLLSLASKRPKQTRIQIASTTSVYIHGNWRPWKRILLDLRGVFYSSYLMISMSMGFVFDSTTRLLPILRLIIIVSHYSCHYGHISSSSFLIFLPLSLFLSFLFFFSLRLCCICILSNGVMYIGLI
ncbi:hypothetical protein L228DRAFT_14592 [Xylona heveae TC161]|uniref:Transmembrane protein n=1 Tax=Xylona heveae (strain CBS 132557 / TC161) TaxID=1328760 RepID=A0A165JR63_XYLHT|nr:hypothetical protein L228DRAFT_14592 [Xylona heveae TC161]KZF26533.1 hypothetical protein L228DRAFT_14592 [Xylona heveae TC161]